VEHHLQAASSSMALQKEGACACKFEIASCVLHAAHNQLTIQSAFMLQIETKNDLIKL